jgi:hypothetical protein
LQEKSWGKSPALLADSIIAVIIFLVLLASMIWASEYIKQKISEDEVRRQLTLASGYALSALIETPGQPSDWNLLPEEQLNESALLSLGLALSESQPWQLDSQKLARLQQISASKYSLIKTQLAMRGPNYDYQLKITSPLQPPVIIGIEPASDAKNIIVVSRLGLAQFQLRQPHTYALEK